MSWVTTKQQAVETAELHAHRAGSGWKIRVWSNLGWCWALEHENGCWDVHFHDFDSSYTAFLHARDNGPGGRWTGGGFTVADACEAARAEAQSEHDELALVLVSSIFTPAVKKLPQRRRPSTRRKTNYRAPGRLRGSARR